MPPKKSSSTAARKRATKPGGAKAARKAARKPTARATPARKAATRKAPARKAPRKPAARKVPTRTAPAGKPPAIEPPIESIFGRRDSASDGRSADDAPRTGAPPVSPFQPGFAPECMACPIGLVFYALKNTKPEVSEHLMRAGFELFQAVRAVMEQYGERWDQAQQLERIPIG